MFAHNLVTKPTRLGLNKSYQKLALQCQCLQSFLLIVSIQSSLIQLKNCNVMTDIFFIVQENLRAAKIVRDHAKCCGLRQDQVM